MLSKGFLHLEEDGALKCIIENDCLSERMFKMPVPQAQVQATLNQLLTIDKCLYSERFKLIERLAIFRNSGTEVRFEQENNTAHSNYQCPLAPIEQIILFGTDEQIIKLSLKLEAEIEKQIKKIEHSSFNNPKTKELQIKILEGLKTGLSSPCPGYKCGNIGKFVFLYEALLSNDLLSDALKKSKNQESRSLIYFLSRCKNYFINMLSGESNRYTFWESSGQYFLRNMEKTVDEVTSEVAPAPPAA